MLHPHTLWKLIIHLPHISKDATGPGLLGTLFHKHLREFGLPPIGLLPKKAFVREAPVLDDVLYNPGR